MAVKNFMKDLIDDEIEGILKNVKMCKCEKCIDDIKAIALNNLKPRYYSTHLGEVYSKTNILATQFRVEVIKELTVASELVRHHTKHEIES
ncbi:MAG: late competence development ComFB family protein [Clostridia bacterium]|nr:late competence development ComFB family protein [Clostridia bacterium]